jgi:hypothetical protein
MPGESNYTGWFIKSNISYGDYLQGKEFERSIRYGINDQTKQLIASNEQLARENYEIMERVDDSIVGGFTTLSTDIATLKDSIDAGFQDMAKIFEWGFSEMLVSLGRVNDSLDALIKIAKTPAQTWAYEQFEIARDEFRRGLYHESLESVLRAINGYGSNPGYKTEFRFHFLQGTIRLGSFKNSDPQLVDPADAEAAFLKAARYANNDLPVEAARALLCAGRAAHVQKKAEDSLKHSTNAILLDAQLAEAYFQSAQACCALGRPQEAMAHLVAAIVYEHDYAVKAANDGDIYRYPKVLKEALILAKNKLKLAYEQEENNFKGKLYETEETAIDKYAVKNLCSEQLVVARNYEKQFSAEASKDNIFGYVHATKLAREWKPVIRSVIASFQQISLKLIDDELKGLQNAVSDVDSGIGKIQSTIADVDSEISKTRPKDYEFIDMAIGVALIVILLVIFLPGNIIGGVIAGIVILSILTGGATILILIPPAMLVNLIRGIIWNTRKAKAQSHKQYLRETIENKAPQKLQLHQEISKLRETRNRIEFYS